ncbi:MAG TPA: hypothetical protein P5513_04160 [Candidatus Diapherotrites archaeon]|nr:hypothetical protein [Candidatus Diapherotrites archaeon]
MFLNSIDRKPLFQKPDGNVVRDLTQSMFDFRTDDYINFSVYRVPRDYAMRPDLIAQVMYNNTIYTEYILKYNGISNPFTIGEGDVIVVPDLNSAKRNTKTRNDSIEGSDAQRIRNSYKYIDPTKVPKRDEALDNFDRRSFSKKSDTIGDGVLPPNIAKEGERGITYRNGRVYFGENIGESACLKNGMSSAEFLTKVIKTRKV